MGKPVRLLVTIIVGNLVVGLTFAALTLIFRHSVLAYQQLHQPGTGRVALVAGLWSRPVQVAVFAVAYVFVIRGLLRGDRRAYRRVRVVSVLGLIGTGYLLASATYPAWLRPVQAVQAALLLTLIWAANRRAVRALFPCGLPCASRRRHRLARTGRQAPAGADFTPAGPGTGRSWRVWAMRSPNSSVSASGRSVPRPPPSISGRPAGPRPSHQRGQGWSPTC